MITKHRMGGIVYNKKKVEEEFLERWKSKDWRDKDNQDNFDFRQQERIYYCKNSHNIKVF